MLDRARQLRREMTLPERLLWREIRGRQLGPRFRRQVPPLPPRGGGGPSGPEGALDPYVVDFYCSEAKLIVEVDGEFHGERHEEDARRTACLERRGYRVVRFQAIEILVDLDAVLETLLFELDPPPALRATSPARGEGPTSPDWSRTFAGRR